jgi:membrane-associated protein
VSQVPLLFASAVSSVVASADFLNPEKIIHWFGPWATIGLFAIVFAESGLLVGFFLPGDSLLFTAGLLASQGKSGLHWPLLAIGCAFFAVLGWQVGYMVGKRVGPALFRRPDSRLFKQEYVERTKEYFDRHGAKTIFIARFVPIVRTFAPILAGVGEMNYASFTRYNVVGGVVWGAGLVIAGKLLGDTIPNVDHYLLPIVALIVIASLIPPLLEMRKHRKEARERPMTVQESELAAQQLEDEL